MIEMRDCRPFLQPKSVAIVGASEQVPAEPFYVTWF
jgi:hypothetical protein